MDEALLKEVKATLDEVGDALLNAKAVKGEKFYYLVRFILRLTSLFKLFQLMLYQIRKAEKDMSSHKMLDESVCDMMDELMFISAKLSELGDEGATEALKFADAMMSNIEGLERRLTDAGRNPSA